MKASGEGPLRLPSDEDPGIIRGRLWDNMARQAAAALRLACPKFTPRPAVNGPHVPSDNRAIASAMDRRLEIADGSAVAAVARFRENPLSPWYLETAIGALRSLHHEAIADMKREFDALKRQVKGEVS